MWGLLMAILLPVALGQLVIPGGEVPIHSLLSPTMQDVTAFVAKNYSARYNQDFKVGVNFKLIGATAQIVAGVNYRLKIAVMLGDNVPICDVTVYEKPWEHKMTITHDSCANMQHRRMPTMSTDGTVHQGGIPGGVFPSTMSPELQKAASFAADDINAASNDMYYMCLMDVQNPSQQVVAGVVYKMDLIFQKSTTLKSSGHQVTVATGCTPDPNGARRMCNVQVQYQSWKEVQYQNEGFACAPM